MFFKSPDGKKFRPYFLRASEESELRKLYSLHGKHRVNALQQLHVRGSQFRAAACQLSVQHYIELHTIVCREKGSFYLLSILLIESFLFADLFLFS